MPYKNKNDAKVWAERNKERVRQLNRAGHIRRKYGMSPEDYDSLLKAQNGTCALCDRRQEEERYGRLHIDHDHETGRIRGLLCWWCNHKTIGKHNDPMFFYRIYKYLQPNVPEVAKEMGMVTDAEDS
ncbi:MAG: hypothetical protein E6R03_06725 [Hyphomicrobiaceae bacterium]|nr:MAG: hypothetical protein E6R03_06725 [Hyphomicrobiaceae bacterium]